MRHHMTQRSSHLILILLFMTIIMTVNASLKAQNPNSKYLTATRYALPALEARTTFPSYELNPSDIQWPPDYATKECLGQSNVKQCTFKYCSKKVALTCWNHAYVIDLQCLCKSMNSTSCSSCSFGVNHQLYP